MWHHWYYSCCGLLVTSTLAFKAMMDPSLASLQISFWSACVHFQFSSGATPADLLQLTWCPTSLSRRFSLIMLGHLYVSLRLRVQNRRKKWNFPPNFWNSIIWTAPFPLNICNGIIWGGAFSKAFRSSEALISVLSKNALLCFRSSEALISVLSKNARL